MLLTISTTHRPTTDPGYLLHKNPACAQTFEFAFGSAHVFYPEATSQRCIAAPLLDIDPLKPVRGPGAVLTDYVNDRPYVSSSLLSVAMAHVFGTAMGGRAKERQELAETPIPLTGPYGRTLGFAPTPRLLVSHFPRSRWLSRPESRPRPRTHYGRPLDHSTTPPAVRSTTSRSFWMTRNAPGCGRSARDSGLRSLRRPKSCVPASGSPRPIELRVPDDTPVHLAV